MIKFLISFLFIFHIIAYSNAGHKIRIVTFNANWLVSTPNDSRYNPRKTQKEIDQHINKITSVIVTIRPDIINLNEVNNKQTLDKVITLLHKHGLNDYKGYHIESNDTALGHDVCFISKIVPDKINNKYIDKKYSRDNKWRAEYNGKNTSVSRNAICFFTVDSFKFSIIGLHLKANPGNKLSDDQRSGQSLVVRKIASYVKSTGYYPIVVGDLNDFDNTLGDFSSSVSSTKVIENIVNYDSHVDYKLFNAAVNLHKDFRYTAHWDKNRNNRIDGGEPLTMIDHVLLPGILRGRFSIFVDHSHGVDFSDHWPVVVDIVVD